MIGNYGLHRWMGVLVLVKKVQPTEKSIKELDKQELKSVKACDIPATGTIWRDSADKEWATGRTRVEVKRGKNTEGASAVRRLLIGLSGVILETTGTPEAVA